MVDYPIPGNDDAIKSISLIISLLSESIIEGRKKFLNYLATETVPSGLNQEPDITKEAAGDLKTAEHEGDLLEKKLKESEEDKAAGEKQKPVRKKKTKKE